MLDDAGLSHVRVLASGDLDAPTIAALEEQGAPIDGYGVGTSLVTARHDPTFSGVYKLAAIGDHPVVKISGTPAKTTSPGCKQVWRSDDGDVIGLAEEQRDGEPLLVEAMRDGRRLTDPVPLAELRERCCAAVDAILPRVLTGRWSVRRSTRLDELRTRLVREMGGHVDEPAG